MPAGRIARGLPQVIEGVGQDEKRPCAVCVQFDAQHVGAPGELQDRGRFERQLLTAYHAPYHVQNDWTGIPIGVCTGPAASWHTLWPHLRHYG